MSAPATDATSTDRDVVILAVPAMTSYLAVLRTATAGLAARLGMTLDEIEDLRIAVDEACAILLPIAAPGSDVTCQFGSSPRHCTSTSRYRSRPPASCPAPSRSRGRS